MTDQEKAIAEQEEVGELARRLLRALAEDAGAQRPGVPVHVNVMKAVDGFAFTLALLIEATPELSGTPREVRTNAEAFAKRVRTYVSGFREATTRNGGITPLEMFFGGQGSFDEDPAVVRAVNKAAHGQGGS